MRRGCCMFMCHDYYNDMISFGVTWLVGSSRDHH